MCSVAFWSKQIKVGTPISEEVIENYVLNVTQAAVEKASGPVYLKVTTQDLEGKELTALLCTLSSAKTETQLCKLLSIFNEPI